jgi:hypothetical protein
LNFFFSFLYAIMWLRCLLLWAQYNYHGTSKLISSDLHVFFQTHGMQAAYLNIHWSLFQMIKKGLYLEPIVNKRKVNYNFIRYITVIMTLTDNLDIADFSLLYDM